MRTDRQRFLSICYALIKRGSEDLKLRELALAITRRAASEAAAAAAIFQYVKKRIRYVRDPVRFEDVQTPRRTLMLSAGDCEDFSILISSLLESIGIRSRLSLVRTEPLSDDVNHIYPAAVVRGRELILDAAQPGAAVGVQHYRVYEKQQAQR
jgi:transglutaminase-like putative cysteine protease